MSKLFRRIFMIGLVVMMLGVSTQVVADEPVALLRYHTEDLALESDGVYVDGYVGNGTPGIILVRPFVEPEAVVIVAKVIEAKATAPELPRVTVVLFDFDKSDIRTNERAALDYVASVLKDNGNVIISIEAHTCNMGADAYNMALSERRAQSVESYLVNKGVDSNQLTTKTFGETMFAFSNDTIANRALNRRAELIVVD